MYHLNITMMYKIQVLDHLFNNGQDSYFLCFNTKPVFVDIYSITKLEQLRPVVAQGDSVTIKSTERGFDPHSR